MDLKTTSIILLLATLAYVNGLELTDKLDTDLPSWRELSDLYEILGDAINARNITAFHSIQDDIEKLLQRTPKPVQSTALCVYVKRAWTGPAFLLPEEPHQMVPCKPVEHDHKPPGMHEIMVRDTHIVSLENDVYDSPGANMAPYVHRNLDKLVSVPPLADWKKIASSMNLQILLGRFVPKHHSGHVHMEYKVYAYYIIDEDCTILSYSTSTSGCAQCPKLSRWNATNAKAFC